MIKCIKDIAASTQLTGSFTNIYFDCTVLSPEKIRNMLIDELRWHYSISYHSESLVEEVFAYLNDISPRSRKISVLLNAQYKDELKHFNIYNLICKQIGLIPEADSYAQGYVKLLYSSRSFSELVFIFHVLTETVAHEYLLWRQPWIQNSEISRWDLQVLEDERRHIGFASALLKHCSRDLQNKEEMSGDRLRKFSREMIQVCKSSLSDQLVTYLADRHDVSPKKNVKHMLDGAMPRTIARATREVNSIL